MNDRTNDVDPLLFKLAVEQTKNYALFLLDPTGHIMTWNLGAERIKGYSPREIIGKHFSIFYTRDAVETGWPDYELKVAGMEGRFEDEGWRVRKDGGRFWANVVITALRDPNGKLLGFSKITRDLTERKMQEEALRISEERVRLLIEGVTDYAIYMLDPEGMITSWNTGAENINGYAREDILGRHFSRFFTAEDIQAGKPWEELALARRVGRAESEGWRLRKDGTRFWSRVVVTALRDPEGSLRGFAQVTQDLTERRHMQDLESAAKNVNEFIGVLAHEMRNPLAPIRMAVQVMKSAPAGEVQEKMRQTIDRQSAHLTRIVDDMLDIVRLTRGTLKMTNTQVDLATVVRSAVEAARPAIEKAGQHLEVDARAGEMFVQGDVDRLIQMLANIVNNATRYTQAGGHVWVTARVSGPRALLCVRDDGCGIDPEMKERIFGMFVQGRPALKRVGGGLGIGLALARRIAELHGGSLEAHSEGEDKGSEFVITLPLVARPSEARCAQCDEKAPATATRRVLVVDDNVDAASALELLLKTLGHETRTVYDGESAIRLARDFRPDIVLLDIGMPGMDGYEVARRLRALDPEHRMRIVAVTGWGQEADRARSQEAGFDVHLVKPVDTNTLADVLTGRGGPTLH